VEGGVGSVDLPPLGGSRRPCITTQEKKKGRPLVTFDDTKKMRNEYYNWQRVLDVASGSIGNEIAEIGGIGKSVGLRDGGES